MFLIQMISNPQARQQLRSFYKPAAVCSDKSFVVRIIVILLFDRLTMHNSFLMNPSMFS